MRRSRELAALTALSLTLALTGCAQDDLLVESGAQSEGQSGSPNLDADRVDTVLQAISSTVEAADAKQDGALLRPRVTDPALRMREAQYALSKADGSPVPTLDFTAQSLTVTNDVSWPRAVVDISQASDGGLPHVFVITQEEPREPYRLQSWVRLLGGTSLTTLSIEQGSAHLDPDATGFTVAPRDTVPGYVEMLNSGTAGDDTFTADEFANIYLADAKSLNDSVQAAGTVTALASTGDFPVTAVELADGSALVSGAFTYSHTYARTVARSTMKLGGKAAALNEGDDSVTGTVTVNYLVTALFRVPAEGAGGKVSLVGVERAIESTSRDDSAKPEGE
ncbi:MAG: hypothetical protein L0L69_00440 [Propionibacterium sp.]|nr:hypothetical protein [Actinomyces sp.]MDN6793528.1 hypothetical protein [Propionibacterium sp.]